MKTYTFRIKTNKRVEFVSKVATNFNEARALALMDFCFGRKIKDFGLTTKCLKEAGF